MVSFGSTNISISKKHSPRSDKGTRRGPYKSNFKVDRKTSFGFGKA